MVEDLFPGSGYQVRRTGICANCSGISIGWCRCERGSGSAGQPLSPPAVDFVIAVLVCAILIGWIVVGELIGPLCPRGSGMLSTKRQVALVGSGPLAPLVSQHGELFKSGLPGCVGLEEKL